MAQREPGPRPYRERGDDEKGAPRRRPMFRRKVCRFCADKTLKIDYKDIRMLTQFVTERGKIRGRANTGTCRKHQKQVAVAIKRAREMALLPYVGDPHEGWPRSRSRRGDDLPGSPERGGAVG